MPMMSEGVLCVRSCRLLPRGMALFHTEALFIVSLYLYLCSVSYPPLET
jgi:hypothetical protein